MFSLFVTNRKDGKEVKISKDKGGNYIKQGKNGRNRTAFF